MTSENYQPDIEVRGYLDIVCGECETYDKIRIAIENHKDI